MAAAKLELKVKGEASTNSSIKVERRVKAEGVCQPPALKLESKVKVATATAVKAELRHQEAKLKAEAPSRISALVQRGLQLRALAAKVKQEGKVKVKKELKRVKKEHKKRKTGGKKGVRRKGSLARRNASREAMNRAVPLSQELAELVGARALSRPEVVSRLWAHFREHGLLNPADKREALFDERLQAIFGKPSARIFELHSLLMPHLDYTGLGAEAAATADDGELRREAKPELKAKGEASAAAKCKAKHEAKHEPRHEAPSNAKLEAPAPTAKRERPFEAAAPPAKREPPREEPVLQQPKREIPTVRTGTSPDVLAAAVGSIVPRFSTIGRTSAVVEFLAPAGDVHLEAVAVPLGSGGSEAAGHVVRRPCTLEFREGADGAFEPCAEVLLADLDPATAYRVSIHALISDAEGTVKEVNSTEATVPQRASPAKWTPSEVQLWCGSLQVPELGRKVREYRIDGATLLALEEEDIRALGVTVPFLVRRVMAALQGLRAG